MKMLQDNFICSKLRSKCNLDILYTFFRLAKRLEKQKVAKDKRIRVAEKKLNIKPKQRERSEGKLVQISGRQ